MTEINLAFLEHQCTLIDQEAQMLKSLSGAELLSEITARPDLYQLAIAHATKNEPVFELEVDGSLHHVQPVAGFKDEAERWHELYVSIEGVFIRGLYTFDPTTREDFESYTLDLSLDENWHFNEKLVDWVLAPVYGRFNRLVADVKVCLKHIERAK